MMLLVPSARAWPYLPLRRLICRCVASSSPDISVYRETFARRMALAGIKSHHRIAVGVSGGPDSMALCALTAAWKADGSVTRDEVSGFVDGLVGIVVDHRLRPESSDEAAMVRDRVRELGVNCEIVCCDWPDGRPKLGHLQEAARDMRYELLLDLCVKQQISILLIAHHADDQAELLVLRLSRNSGVMGLAGMAFVSQLFPKSVCANQGVLLVRPMLEFSKDDIYKICQGSNLQWVEDPTNKSMLFARNRIRSSLTTLSSCSLWSEVQHLISACRLTRAYVDKVCQELISQSLTISEFGYATIDLEKLNPADIDDLCLSHYLTTIVQYISQKHRPVRGRSSRLLMDYTRDMPCKSSLTVAGCNLSPAPGSKGRKIVVSFSADSHDSSKHASAIYSCLPNFQFEERRLYTELGDIFREQNLGYHLLVREKSSVPFVNAKSPMDILNEAKKLNLIGDFTLKELSLLQLEEQNRFSSSKEINNDKGKFNKRSTEGALSVHLKPGHVCHFMNRFLVTYKVNCSTSNKSEDHHCQFCQTSGESEIAIRHMVDADWLFLSEASRSHHAEKGGFDPDTSTNKSNHAFSEFMVVSAAEALNALRLIPASARRALPVVVNNNEVLLSVPILVYYPVDCFRVLASDAAHAYMRRLILDQEYPWEEAIVHTCEELCKNLYIQAFYELHFPLF